MLIQAFEYFRFIGSHPTLEPMPMALRKQNPKWECVDIKRGTVLLNNVYALPEKGKRKEIMRMATENEMEQPENLTWIYMPYNSSWMFYVPAEQNEIISHPNLRWYINGDDPPVLIYYTIS